MSKERPFEDITPVSNIEVGYFEKEAYLEIIDRQEKQIESFAYQIMALQSRIEILEKSQRSHGEWTPVSERLPRRNGCYNVTRIIEGTAISGVCYFDGSNTWHADTGVNHGRPYLTDIIAWQPLPEPYKEIEND